jgi:hypothetical protein
MDSNLTDIHIIKQTSKGETPAGALTKVRFTGEDLLMSLNKADSKEIRADGNVSDLLMKSGSQSGGWNFEFAASAASGTTGADTVMNDLLAALMGGSWSTGTLKNAANMTKQYFTIEKSHAVGTTTHYFPIIDCVPVQLDLNIAAEEDVTGKWTFMGGIPQDPATDPTNTPTDPIEANSNGIMCGSFDVAKLEKDDTEIASYIQSISLSIHRNPRRIVAINYPWGADVGFGSWSITGTMNVYFDGASWYEAARDNTGMKLVFALEDNEGVVSGNKYTFTMPIIKLLDSPFNAAGKDQDLIQTVNFQAVYDVTSECSLQIDYAAKADA